MNRGTGSNRSETGAYKLTAKHSGKMVSTPKGSSALARLGAHTKYKLKGAEA